MLIRRQLTPTSAPIPALNLRRQSQSMMQADQVGGTLYRSRPSNASIAGVMNKLVAGTEVTIAAVTTFTQDIPLPASLQGKVGARVITGFALDFSGLRGVMPTGFTADALLKTLAAATIVTVLRGDKIEHEIGGKYLVENMAGEYGFGAVIEPDSGAFTSLIFRVAAAVIPIGAFGPNEYFFTPQIFTIWENID